MNYKKLLPLLLCAALTLSGCSASAVAAPTGDVPRQQATPISTTAVELSGSVAALPLMLGLADGAGQRGLSLNITAAGKSASLETLAAGACDLAMFEGNSDDIPAGAAGTPVAYQAVAVIVNPSCGVSDLTSEQLTAIFTGQCRDWSEFGGSGAVTVVVPAADDTFRQAFEELFGLRASATGIMQSLLTDSALVTADVETEVVNRAGAIGICPAASPESRAQTLLIDGVSLCEETLQSGSYPAARTIMIVLKEDPSDDARAFYDYCVSAQAAGEIQASGYMPII